jgi:hypothetical protein
MEATARPAGFRGVVAGRSLTELKLSYAFPSDTEQRRRSHIFIRELDYAGMPNAVRTTYDERFVARDNSPDERRAAVERWQQLEAPKARLRHESPDRVHA